MNRKLVSALWCLGRGLGLGLGLGLGFALPAGPVWAGSADLKSLESFWSWDEKCYHEAMIRFPEFTEEGEEGRTRFIRRCLRFGTVLQPTTNERRAAGLDKTVDPSTR